MHDIIRQRLANQRLSASSLREPADVVAWLGAMQSQDFPGAKWAIGQRAAVTEADVNRAYDEGAIIRTHVLRQTWHFVARDDLRWLLALSGPRVNAVNAHYYRKMNLDERTFTRSRTVLERALRDRQYLTRSELKAALAKARIVAEGPRLAFLIMRVELDAVVCSGPRRGNQLTYALIEERVPRAKSLDRDAALATLARRYFASHGPATLKDYVWWSGLTVRDAKAGIELAASSLIKETIDGFTYWSVDGPAAKAPRSPSAHLLPNYDEYLIAHKDRGLVTSPGSGDGVTRIKDPFVHHIVVDGRLAGSWTRTASNSSIAIGCSTYARPSEGIRKAIEASVARLGRFVNQPATSSWADRR